MMETLKCNYYDQTEKTTRALDTSSFKCYMCWFNDSEKETQTK